MSIHTPRMFTHVHTFQNVEQENALNTHIDTLAEWWENAEKGAAEKGDTLIWRKSGPSYEMFTSDEFDDSLGVHVRILARAPKPAWHDAVAVIAHIGGNELPRVLVRDNDGAFVDGLTGSAYVADRLRDVTPLIEAKVTDEMVKRAEDWYADSSVLNDASEDVAGILNAALGLDPA